MAKIIGVTVGTPTSPSKIEQDLKPVIDAAVEEAVAKAGGGSGTTDHSALLNRDLHDQHPMSAITGLEEALSTFQTADDVRKAIDKALGVIENGTY